MACTPCAQTLLDHPRKIYDDGVCDKECVPVGENFVGVKFNEVSCEECEAMAMRATQYPGGAEAWGDIKANCLASCKISGSAEIETVTEEVKNKNKNIAITAIIIIVFLIIAVLIYTW